MTLPRSPALVPACRGGFTLIEVLIAIFVVSVGVLGTMSALWYGIRSERYSERRTAAVFVVREMLNQIRSQNLPFTTSTFPAVGSELNDGSFDDDSDDSGPKRAFNAPPFANTTSFGNTTESFQRRIEMKRLSTNENDYRSTIAAVKVSLFWNEGASEKKVTLWAYHRKP